jgi:hypothetical protein
MKEKNTASAEILSGLPFQKAYERLLKKAGHREQEKLRCKRSADAAMPWPTKAGKPFGSKSKASKRANAC